MSYCYFIDNVFLLVDLVRCIAKIEQFFFSQFFEFLGWIVTRANAYESPHNQLDTIRAFYVNQL